MLEPGEELISNFLEVKEPDTEGSTCPVGSPGSHLWSTHQDDGFGSPAQATAEAKSCKAEIVELQEQLAAEKAGSGAFWGPSSSCTQEGHEKPSGF